MKPIRSAEDHAAALARIDALLAASEGTPEADELEVLAILVEKYEAGQWPIPDAPPHEVLRLVMEANGLSRKDLARYLGSPAAVSKVLSGKKELTLSQVRVLGRELGIPVAALVGGDVEPGPETDWSRFPLQEMARRGLFGTAEREAPPKTLARRAEELLSRLVAEAGLDIACEPCLRQGLRPGPDSNPYAVLAWLLEVAVAARRRLAHQAPDPYRGLSQADLRQLAMLSKTREGLVEAVAFLARRGVPVVVVPHYKRSRIDGGVVMLNGGRPAIGLTLRYDRVDHFWFTLLHECAHIVLGHVQGYLAEECREDVALAGVEREANALVEAVTVPEEAFASAVPDPGKASLQDVIELAQRWGVGVPVVAGRVRFRSGDYRKFSGYVGRGEVRELLTEAVVSV